MRKLRPRMFLKFAQDHAGFLVRCGPEQILLFHCYVTPASLLSSLSSYCGIVNLMGLPERCRLPVRGVHEGSGTVDGISCSFLLAPALGRPTCSEALCPTPAGARGPGPEAQVQALTARALMLLLPWHRAPVAHIFQPGSVDMARSFVATKVGRIQQGAVSGPLLGPWLLCLACDPGSALITLSLSFLIWQRGQLVFL